MSLGARTVSRRGLLAALGAAALGLPGCVDQHPEASSDDASGLRLVATSPAVADICDRLEMDLVGVPDSSVSTIPSRYDSAERIGTAMSPDIEKLSALAPDYVISPDTLQSDLQPKYAAAGLASVFVNLRSVTGMYAAIDWLGDRFGHEEQAAGLRGEYQDFLDDYESQSGDGEGPTVLALMGLPGSYVVATTASYVGSLVTLAGGRNVYESDTDQFVNANTEDMESRDPDVILRAAHALPDEVMEMFAEEFAENDIWRHFRAVEDDRVFDLPYDQFGMSATFAWTDALTTLRPMLYPSA